MLIAHVAMIVPRRCIELEVAQIEQTRGRISFWPDILIAYFLHLNGYSFIIYIEFFYIYFYFYIIEIRNDSLNEDTNAWTNFQKSFYLNASAFQARLPHLFNTSLKCSVHDTQTSNIFTLKHISYCTNRK